MMFLRKYFSLLTLLVPTSFAGDYATLVVNDLSVGRELQSQNAGNLNVTQQGLFAISTLPPTESPAPSPSPSSAPSEAPTDSPAPSPSPSSAPTQAPTGTSNPTAAPTDSPTDSPAPSPSPSAAPSPAPSDLPSESPTAFPTFTFQPTLSPSSSPSSLPSDLPSYLPSSQPSLSHQPSSTPSMIPSSEPSEAPTNVPSATPTLSNQPSHGPTPEPSSLPSDLPSFAPTGAPTSSPSTKPSAIPSYSPTQFPTLTTTPSDAPSLVPTGQPTTSPTVSAMKTKTASISVFLEGITYEMDDGPLSKFEIETLEFIRDTMPNLGNNFRVDVLAVTVLTQVFGDENEAELETDGQRRKLSDEAMGLKVSFRVVGVVSTGRVPPDYDFGKHVSFGFRNHFPEYLQRLADADDFFKVLVDPNTSNESSGSGGSKAQFVTAITCSAVAFVVAVFASYYAIRKHLRARRRREDMEKAEKMRAEMDVDNKIMVSIEDVKFDTASTMDSDETQPPPTLKVGDNNTAEGEEYTTLRQKAQASPIVMSMFNTIMGTEEVQIDEEIPLSPNSMEEGSQSNYELREEGKIMKRWLTPRISSANDAPEAFNDRDRDRVDPPDNYASSGLVKHTGRHTDSIDPDAEKASTAHWSQCGDYSPNKKENRVFTKDTIGMPSGSSRSFMRSSTPLASVVGSTASSFFMKVSSAFGGKKQEDFEAGKSEHKSTRGRSPGRTSSEKESKAGTPEPFSNVSEKYVMGSQVAYSEGIQRYGSEVGARNFNRKTGSHVANSEISHKTSNSGFSRKAAASEFGTSEVSHNTNTTRAHANLRVGGYSGVTYTNNQRNDNNRPSESSAFSGYTTASFSEFAEEKQSYSNSRIETTRSNKKRNNDHTNRHDENQQIHSHGNASSWYDDKMSELQLTTSEGGTLGARVFSSNQSPGYESVDFDGDKSSDHSESGEMERYERYSVNSPTGEVSVTLGARPLGETEQSQYKEKDSLESGLAKRAGSYDVFAPSGPIGIVVDTTKDGPAVHSLKSTSPMLGLITNGDLIIALDGVDTRNMTAASLTKLMAKKSRAKERKITLLSMDGYY